jgi:hypothetical protein
MLSAEWKGSIGCHREGLRLFKQILVRAVEAQTVESPPD